MSMITSADAFPETTLICPDVPACTTAAFTSVAPAPG
jgi:hypothetical protein